MSFNQIIKIPNRKFDELTPYEVGLLIDADSSLSPEGNAFFASCALDEFLHSAKLKNQQLLKIRKEILSGIYLDTNGTVDTEFLKKLSAKLKSA